MTYPELVDRVAESIWGSPTNQRVVTWASVDEKAKDLWRADAKRAIAEYQKHVAITLK